MSDPFGIGHNGSPDDDDERAGNWFAVSRDVFSHYLVGIHDRPYTDFEAWLSLLAMASYGTRKVVNKGKIVVLDPGELMASHSFLAQRWMWSPDKVRWYLKRLVLEAMVTRITTGPDTKRNTNQIQVISISNYSIYQFYGRAQRQAEHQAEHQANTSCTPSQHQESNKETNKQEDSLCAADAAPAAKVAGAAKEAEPKRPADWEQRFEDFWQAFPKLRRRGKGKCRDLFGKIVAGKSKHGRATAEVMIEAVRQFRGIDPEQPPMPATWLNEGRWQDDPHAGAKPKAEDPWWKANPEAAARMTPERWREGIRKYANGTWPTDKLGPAPGARGCLVPANVVAEMQLEEIYDENGLKRANAPAANWQVH